MTDREVMKQALDALKNSHPYSNSARDLDKHSEAITTLRAALEQQEQRKPLTIAEVEQILAQHNYEIHGDRARYIVRMTEEAHGIGEKT